MPIEAVGWNTRARDQRDFPTRLREVTFNGAVPVVALMEVNGGRQHVAQFARQQRYDVIPGVEADEVTGSSQLLIARELGVVNSGVIRITNRWYGPKGRAHEGRAYPWAAVRHHDDRLVLYIDAHMIWGPFKPRNWRAHVAELRALRRFVQARKTTDILILMDANQPASRRGPGSMRAFARQIGGQIITTGASIDYAIYRPAPRPARPVRKRRLVGRTAGLRGSDHPVCRYEEAS